jgi:GNAT superfamily N-acetyltransferase
MSELSLRRATLGDLDFVTTAIIEAERSGTEQGVYERVFGLGRGDLAALLADVLREEIPGSELCCSNFLLALDAGVPVGGIATWVEADGEPPSNLVRANLLSYALGAERWVAARPRLELLAGIDTPRAVGAGQIEAVYVAATHRGRRIAQALIERAVDAWRAERPDVAKVQISSVLENAQSLRAFERAGFSVVRTTRADGDALRAIFPGTGKILWERAVA